MNEEAANTTKQMIKEAGGEASTFIADVVQESACKALVDAAVERYGKLDILMNSVGIGGPGAAPDVTEETWNRVMDVDLKSMVFISKYAIPEMIKNGGGSIINIASVAGLKVFSPGGTVYSGTKFAVRAISEGLRHEVGGSIRTTTIEPGAVDSELKFGSTHQQSRDFVVDFYKHAIPAESVARAIAFAIEQPADVDINEIVLRPTVQEF